MRYRPFPLGQSKYWCFSLAPRMWLSFPPASPSPPLLPYYSELAGDVSHMWLLFRRLGCVPRAKQMAQVAGPFAHHLSSQTSIRMIYHFPDSSQASAFPVTGTELEDKMPSQV